MALRVASEQPAWVVEGLSVREGFVRPAAWTALLGIEGPDRWKGTMAFSEMEIEAPTGLTTRDFLLRPIRASDAKLDYDAVMESSEFLRAWEQSTWPEDDFTVEANREDLVKAERRHANGEAFTYTMMNLEQTECLGCVYVLPPDAKMFAGAQVAAMGADQWPDCDATVFFWVRKSRLPEGLDSSLLDSLLTWLEQEWTFHAPLIVTNEQVDQQVAMIEGTELRRRFEVKVPDDPGKYLAYA
jgi:hypothetical protein